MPCLVAPSCAHDENVIVRVWLVLIEELVDTVAVVLEGGGVCFSLFSICCSF